MGDESYRNGDLSVNLLLLYILQITEETSKQTQNQLINFFSDGSMQNKVVYRQIKLSKNGHFFWCDFPSSKYCSACTRTECETGLHTDTHTHTDVQCWPVRWTYPSVLMKPLVDPSAYREQMSPIWRKLDILSDMFDT